MIGSDLDPEEIARRITALGEWFHNIDLRGVKTAPNHFLGDYPAIKWRKLAPALPSDLAGMTVLDIGCNAGFYAIEMKRLGAEYVLGLDTSKEYLAQARFAADVCKVDIEFRRLSAYDIAKLGQRFDIVLFMGVLYHLRHPLLALDLIWEHVCGDLLVFQSMQRGSTSIQTLAEDYPFEQIAMFEEAGFPKLHFIERAYCADGTNWWIPNRACAEAMLRSAGFTILARPEQEVYLCRRGQREPHVSAVYPARRETGRDDRSGNDLERAEQQVALGS
jgi:tRNA (mo5U34)-methyltransferase